MTPSVLISLIGCGRREGTQRCLQKALTTAPHAQFVLTNNASRDGTGEMFELIARPLRNVTIFHEPENTGFIPPGNRSFHLSVTRGCEFTVLLNDDTDPPDGWLEKLLAPFDDPSVALTCPHGTCCSLDHNFHGFEGDRFEYCEGSCLAIRNSAIQSFTPTLFDENLTGIYGDDSNLSLRVREKGYSIARADFHMPHIRSATTRAPEVKAFCDYHQAKNHVYNAHRWAHYLRTRRMDFPILLSRSYAIGDVLLLTPIIRAIANSNPLSPVYVSTDFPEIFARNPNVYHAGKTKTCTGDTLQIDLDGSYENTTMTHIVHAYEATVRQHLPGLEPVELRTELFPAEADAQWARQVRDGLAGTKPLAIIGSDPTTWTGKNWPGERFSTIRHWLEQKGWATVAVGTKKPELQTTIHQLAALLSLSQLFIGNDSFPMHAAQAMGCPTVGIFGATLPRCIFTQGSKAAAAVASPAIPCAGARHRVVGTTHVPCDGACIRSVTVEDVQEAITKLEVL
jgi:ADP-heptose:LPS heptosyltransferase/GT2 family glycosyltransferase